MACSIASLGNWLRANLISELCLNDALEAILHNDQLDPSYVGLPRNGVQLHAEMTNFRNSPDGKKLTTAKVLRQNQWDNLCPANGISHSKDWDITIKKIVIQYNCLFAHPLQPIGGWRIYEPSSSDMSKAAFVIRAKNLRNELKHGTVKKIAVPKTYDNIIARIEYILNGLNYQNMPTFEDLKTRSLEEYTEKLVNIVKANLENEILIVKNELTETTKNADQNKDDILTHSTKISTLHDMITELQCGLGDLEINLRHRLQIELANCHTAIYEVVKIINMMYGEIEQLKRVTKSHDKEIEDIKQKLPVPTDVVLSDCLEIVSTQIGKDWKKLAMFLKLPIKDSCEDATSYNNMMQCFGNAGFAVSWNSLKAALQFLKKENIIKKLIDDTNLTVAIDAALREYRSSIQAKFQKQQVPKPFMTKSGERHEKKSHEQVFVDLAIIKGRISASEYTNHEYFMRQATLEKHSLNITEIVGTEDEYTLISGIPGIGKSQLVDEIHFKWANGQILNGKGVMPNIELLLPIKCREMNALNLAPSDGFVNIFKFLFPNLFYTIDINALHDLKNKILIIVDGIDELVSVDEINQPTKCTSADSQKLHFMRELITASKEKKLLPYRYTIAVGRPRITEIIKQSISGKIRAKEVQVCGFSTDSVHKYIEKHCDTEKIKSKVRQEVHANRNMQNMSQIPVYLWVICNIYKSDLSITTPKTVTELMIYACLVFIREHLISSEGTLRNSTLKQLCENSDILSLIKSIAKLSFVSLKERKIIFQYEELHKIITDVENLEKRTGLIVKHENDSESTYEFSHLVLHEFFAALHMFLSDDLQPRLGYLKSNLLCGIVYVDVNETENTREFALSSDEGRSIHIHDYDEKKMTDLQCCYPIIAGLEGLFSSNMLLSTFIRNLLAPGKSELGSETSLMTLWCHCIQRDLQADTPYCENPRNYIYYSQFIYSFIQCCLERGEIPTPIVDIFLEKPPYFETNDKFMLASQYDFVKWICTINNSFCLQNLWIAPNFNPLSDDELDALAYLSCCSKAFYMKEYSRQFYCKFLNHLQSMKSSLGCIHVYFNMFCLNSLHLEVLSSVLHLHITLDISKTFKDNLVNNVASFTKFVLEIKKIDIKNLRVQADSNMEWIEMLEIVSPMIECGPEHLCLNLSPINLAQSLQV